MGKEEEGRSAEISVRRERWRKGYGEGFACSEGHEEGGRCMW